MQTQFEEAKAKTESLQANAARYFNPNEPLKLERIPKPQPGPNDVLIRVKAAGICHTDLHIMAGMMPTRPPPVTLGHEIAGQVEETGPNVTQFKKGNRTVVHFISPCGNCRYCLEGRGVQCENLFNRPFYGASHDGGYAEYCTVDADRLVPIPEDVAYDFAATLACAGLTAYHAVSKVGQVKLAENVGIYGTGGVGMYALQMAANSGANVIAISRNQKKLQMAETLGANYTINKNQASVPEEIKKATSGRGVDVMFDFVANDQSITESANSLANGGRLILVGVSDRPLPLDAQSLVFRGLSVSGSLVGTKNELVDLMGLAKTQEIQSVVTRGFKLQEVNEALELLRQGEIIGRSYVSI
jgi:2-desacetyl-2-hydroxyethyl bacteriochlorophyllide A dehydrogenase